VSPVLQRSINTPLFLLGDGRDFLVNKKALIRGGFLGWVGEIPQGHWAIRKVGEKFFYRFSMKG